MAPSGRARVRPGAVGVGSEGMTRVQEGKRLLVGRRLHSACIHL